MAGTPPSSPLKILSDPVLSNALAEVDARAREDAWSTSHFVAALACASGQHVFTLSDPSSSITAFLVEQVVGDEAELLLMVTDPGFQRRGLARKLLLGWHEDLRHRGVARIFLEVRHDNAPARKLYEACGYREMGRRRNYYQQPPGDAVLYSRDLDQAFDP